MNYQWVSDCIYAFLYSTTTLFMSYGIRSAHSVGLFLTINIHMPRLLQWHLSPGVVCILTCMPTRQKPTNVEMCAC